MKRGWPLLGALLILTGCGPTPQPRYHLGGSYQAGGAWHYPRESFELEQTGLGAVLPTSRPALTANGEAYDPSAMAAEHPTLQLPAIARVTNLENGLDVVVRINGRGTGNPRRLVEFTPRVARLLQVPDAGPVKMRLTVLGPESQDAIAGLPGAPTLAIDTVPRGRIETTELAPPLGVAAVRSVATAAPTATASESPASRTVPTRLPEALTREPLYATDLMVRLGTFEQYQYAALQRARVAGLRPTITTVWQGRARLYRVSIGPFATARDAEVAQTQAMASGVPDARIVVE